MPERPAGAVGGRHAARPDPCVATALASSGRRGAIAALGGITILDLSRAGRPRPRAAGVSVQRDRNERARRVDTDAHRSLQGD